MERIYVACALNADVCYGLSVFCGGCGQKTVLLSKVLNSSWRANITHWWVYVICCPLCWSIEDMSCYNPQLQSNFFFQLTSRLAKEMLSEALPYKLLLNLGDLATHTICVTCLCLNCTWKNILYWDSFLQYGREKCMQHRYSAHFVSCLLIFVRWNRKFAKMVVSHQSTQSTFDSQEIY